MNSLPEYFHSGGIVIYAIIAISLYAWILAFRGLNKAYGVYRNLNILNRKLSRIQTLPALLKRTYLINLFSREKIHAPSGSIGEEEKILHEYRLMVDRCLAVTSGSLHTLKVLTSVLPLLGLFGTVLGMLETFREIRDFGMGNPSFLTGGIQKALMTTQAGLMTALPVFVLHHIVSALHRKASLRGKRVEKYLSEIILELKKAYTSNQLNPLHFGFGHSKVSIKTG